ncbi:MAG: phosphoserine phosphatase SerB [Deltaproteobacteria bacterium]|nr:phosphoserine phosphatase SerB [Deltaproteobacteria bacterium]
MQENENKQVIVTVTGRDAPGITSGLTEILNREGVRLLDMEQAVTHGLLSLSLVIQFVGNGSADVAVLKDLLFKAKELGVNLDFTIVEGDAPARSSATQFAITLLSEDLQARHVAAIAAVLARRKVNIDSIRKLNEGGLSCLELITYTNSQIDVGALKDDLLKVSSRFPAVDIAVQRENLYRRAKRLVVMDMDSTLIQVEVIDEMAKLAGVGRQVSEITERAMQGHMDFDESLRQRVELLKGLSESEMKLLADRIPLTPGAEVLVKTLKRLGYKIALISGGFSYFGEKLKEKLGLHYVYTNVLEIEGGKLTGRVTGSIVNAQRKADLLELIAQQEGVTLESVIAIGDGANDILMLKKAGLGIAFNAKRKTQEAAGAAINQKTLASILYLLGITDKDIEDVVKL